jgi:hypothetical protein
MWPLVVKLRIRPLTHKMKNRVKNHGDWWLRRAVRFEDETLNLDGMDWSLEPLVQKDPEKPYACWVKQGRDFTVLEVKED